MSDLLLAPRLLLGGIGALVHVCGSLVQERREALCGLSDVIRCRPGSARTLCLHGTTPGLGGLALDRRALPEPGRLVTLQRLFIAPSSRYLVPRPAGDTVALIGTTFAPIRRILSAIGDPIPIIRDPIPIVGGSLPLGRRLHASEDRHCLMVIEPPLVPQPGALPLQRLIIRVELRRPASDPHRPTLDLSPSGLVTLLSPPDLRALDIRPVGVQLRRLTLDPRTPPLKLSPLRLTASIPLHRGGFMADSTLLVHTPRPVKSTLHVTGLPGGESHRESIPCLAQDIKR